MGSYLETETGYIDGICAFCQINSEDQAKKALTYKNQSTTKHYSVITLILVNTVPSWDIKGRPLMLASFDFPTTDNIHQYQCNNPFII